VEDVQHKQVEEWRTPSSLEISYLVTRPATKLLMLCRMLEREPDNKYIVYMATCACVNYFNKVLSGLERLSKFKIVALHGQLDSKKRSIAFNTFSRVPEGTPAILLCTDVAARGLDLPFVDRVVQYDPPQDPRAFSHRCGRTARAGRKGKAVVFVSRGPEEVYAEFMRVRKIPMVRHDYINHQRQLVPIDDVDDDSSIQMEQDDHEHVQDLMQEIRQMAIADRDIYEKGTRAFVSYVQSYAKHEAAYIFRIRELDLGAIATSFGLLRLPKMPELNRSSHLVQFSSWEGNPDALTYADAPREKQRQERLKQLEIKRQEAIEAGEPLFKNTHKSSQPWSKVREARAKRKENREKRHKKAEYRQQQKMDTQREALGLEKAKRKQVDVSDFEQEWEELQREERLAKQLKKGKIDKKTYAKLVGEDEEGELL
jgi:ATP-dependent RNA helicase DDX55/SPB4